MLRTGLVFALFVTFSTSAYAADWRYFGDTGSKVEISMFYEASTLERPIPTTVKVWVKGLPEKELLRHSAKGHDRPIAKALARKMKAGYMPGYLLLPAIRNRISKNKHKLAHTAMGITMFELLADSNAVKPITAEYMEIDCKGKRFAFLSLINYGPKGTVKNMENFSVPRFAHIAPDSTGQWLSELVCPKQ